MINTLLLIYRNPFETNIFPNFKTSIRNEFYFFKTNLFCANKCFIANLITMYFSCTNYNLRLGVGDWVALLLNKVSTTVIVKIKGKPHSLFYNKRTVIEKLMHIIIYIKNKSSSRMRWCLLFSAKIKWLKNETVIM